MDMWASYDTLFSKVTWVLQKDPFSGHLFVFFNSKRNTIKCLFYDGTGLVLLRKRLERELRLAIKENFKLRQQNLTESQLGLFMSEHIADLEEVVFGKSSEQYKKSEKLKEEKKSPLPRVRRPSERYPQLPVRDVIVRPPHPPNCVCCGGEMSESGLTEVSEQLNVIPPIRTINGFSG